MQPNCRFLAAERGESNGRSSPMLPTNVFTIDGDSGATPNTPVALKLAAVSSMKAEVDAAVNFLTFLLVKARLNPPQAPEHFRRALTALLVDRYAGHWYPAEPLKGSGYRCLRVNGVMHPLLTNAAALCHIPFVEFRRAFPAEFTIWIDPGDVNVRIGEEGSIGVYFAKNGASSAGASSSAPTTPISQVSVKSRCATSATVDGTSPAPHNKLRHVGSSVVGCRVSPTVLFNQPQLPPTALTSSRYQATSSKNLSPTPFDGCYRSQDAATPRFLPAAMVAPSGEYFTLCGNVHVGGGRWRRSDEMTTTSAASKTSAITLTPTKRRPIASLGLGAAQLAVEA